MQPRVALEEISPNIVMNLKSSPEELCKPPVVFSTHQEKMNNNSSGAAGNKFVGPVSANEV